MKWLSCRGLLWERILEGTQTFAFASDAAARLVIRAVVTEPASVAKLVAALRRPRDPPAAA